MRIDVILDDNDSTVVERGLVWDMCPRRTEVLTLNGGIYIVEEVSHDYDSKTIVLTVRAEYVPR